MTATNKQAGIYRIRIADHFYIGSSSNLHKRWREHERKLKKGKHKNIRMARAYNKYGTFEVECLVRCDVEDLTFYEQLFLDEVFNDHYCMNINPSASRPPVGCGRYWLGKSATNRFALKVCFADGTQKVYESCRAAHQDIGCSKALISAMLSKGKGSKKFSITSVAKV